MKLEDEEIPLWKHCFVGHCLVKAEFSMKVMGRFYSCLVRQFNEAVRIYRSATEYVQNRNAEFHKSSLVRVVAVSGLHEEKGEGPDLS